MKEAASAAWDQDWARAIQAYQRALQAAPDDSQALVGLASCQMGAGQYNQAIGTYERVSKLVPSDPLPQEKLAEIFEIIGKPREAAQKYLTAGEVYWARKDIQRAVPNWENAVRLDPDVAQAHMRLALVYEQNPATHQQAIYEYLQLARLLQQYGQVQRAEQALQRALNLDSINSDVRNAVDDLKRGKPIQVGEQLTPAPQPRSTGPLGQPAPQVAEEEQEDELIKALEEGEVGRTPIDETARYAMGVLADIIWTGEVPPAAQAPLLEGIDAHQVGDLEGAIEAYSQVLKAGLDHPALRFCLGALYNHARRFQEAVTILARIADNPDYSLASHLVLGQAFFAQDDLRASATHLLQALRMVDELVNTGQVDVRGYERALSGLTEQPVEYLNELVKALTFYLQDAKWREKLHTSVTSYTAQGKVSYVQDLLELIIEGGRPEIADVMQRINMYMERNQLAMAIEEVHYAIGRAPDYLPAHRRLADIFIREARTQEAVVKINLIANAYLMRGNMDKAADLFAEVIDLWPADTEARRRVIDMMISQERVSEALHHYAELANLYYRLMADPDQATRVYSEALDYAKRKNAEASAIVPILKALADIESQRLNWREALRYYDRVIELDPSDRTSALAAVDLYFQVGEAAKAVAALDNCIRQCITTGQGAHILPILEDQVRQRPDVIPLRQRLAEVYRQNGRIQESIAQMDALGELLLDAGRIDEAIATIKKIIGMNPPDVEGYRHLLEQLESGAR